MSESAGWEYIMRVAFLVGPFPKLSKTFILDQITGLLKRDVHLDVFAEPAPDQGKMHLNFIEHDINSRLIYSRWGTGPLVKRFLKLP